MQREQADHSYLWDMLAAARAVQRHVLAHDYGEIKHDRLWQVATAHVPSLIGQIEPLLPPPPEDE